MRPPQDASESGAPRPKAYTSLLESYINGEKPEHDLGLSLFDELLCTCHERRGGGGAEWMNELVGLAPPSAASHK